MSPESIGKGCNRVWVGSKRFVTSDKSSLFPSLLGCSVGHGSDSFYQLVLNDRNLFVCGPINGPASFILLGWMCVGTTAGLLWFDSINPEWVPSFIRQIKVRQVQNTMPKVFLWTPCPGSLRIFTLWQLLCQLHPFPVIDRHPWRHHAKKLLARL